MVAEGGSGYKARSSRNEPTAQTAPQWTAALWARLETLIEDMASCCIKVGHLDPGLPPHERTSKLTRRLSFQVYTLEKVLRVKKDPATQTPFLDEAMKVSSEQDEIRQRGEQDADSPLRLCVP